VMVVRMRVPGHTPLQPEPHRVHWRSIDPAVNVDESDEWSA
jgi:hypothetical protein